MAKTFLEEISTLKIWDRQKDAVTNISEYQNSKNLKPYLVKIPTGKGKTGVFASLTRVAHSELNYLVITPSTALKFQN